VSLPALRQQLADLSPPPRAGSATIPTGIDALDRVLSGGGLPSGRLTELVGRRGSGRTTLVRQIVEAAVAARRWVAVVDGSRTLAPRDWAGIGDRGRLWIVRPPAPDLGAWCTDILLRSGAFSLVVLDGAPPLPRQVAVRLTRLAREHDVALVLTGEAASGVVGSAVRLRMEKRAEGRGHRTDKSRGQRAGEGRGQRAEGRAGNTASRVPRPAPYESRITSHESRVTNPESRITIAVEKGCSHHPVEVRCAIDVARRLCAHPEVPDRRGVARRDRQGEQVESPHRKPGTGGRGQRAIEGRGQRAEGRAGDEQRDERRPIASGTLPYKRRCAEPLVRHDTFLLAARGGCR
jgi:recombination protein RecA